ncbi:threonine ammonia-lyase IlvA [Apibacter raozihei]|uniref:threonine ammonia-lyase IlvA n=1 Tax=Apibacter TaxID=1778601 RepID=UPI000FE3F09B|nr:MULTISPECIES: threonine ammonia-lyase IlvA [Apibacter]
MSAKITKEFKLHIEEAAARIKEVVKRSPLEYNHTLSNRFHAQVYLKREDVQVVRSYKLRGAYNMMSSLDPALLSKGVTCASAGNHAQGVAYCCNKMKVRGVIFMPKITPKQKVKQTKMFGKDFVEIVLVGDTFDESAEAAKQYTKEHDMTFIPPFDDRRIIEGQGTIGMEILKDFKDKKIDYIFIPNGGGGLCSGVGAYIKDYSPDTQIIGVEPTGAASMKKALKEGHPVTLEQIDRFVDGAAVKRVGDITYQICSKVLDKICLIPEGEVCSTILKLYNEDAIVAEPAGALSISALNHYASEIKGKNVICIVSGSNNDINRMQEIKERSLIFEGLKHYFIVRFPQRPSALRDFVNQVLNEHVDIVRFEYMKKNERETGPALVGIELDSYLEYEKLWERMTEYGLDFMPLDPNSDIGRFML